MPILRFWRNNLSGMLHPRYWLLWLGVGLLRLLANLPYRWLLRLGKGIGFLAYFLAKHRRNIVNINLKLCFPELSEAERRRLAKQCFYSAGMGLFETVMAWWMPARRFKQIPFHFVGLEHLAEAKAKGKGVLMCGAHFTCLEIVGRSFSEQNPVDLVYRMHDNPILQQMMATRRSRYVQHCIDRYDVKAMVRTLRAGNVLWYAPDQDLGRDRSVFVPFFNVQTATLKATAWLAKMGQATTIQVFYRRLPNYAGYETVFTPVFENFPSGDEAQDARLYNANLENYVKQYPDQYLWHHRRFKTRPEGEKKFY
jgi:KDO2-lipid IV(A) lauroyltransferase